MKELAKYADYLFYLSLIGLLLAAYGALTGNDVWLAPTQWTEVSVGAVVYALYVRSMK